MGHGVFDLRPTLLPALLVLTALTLQVLAVQVPVLGRGWTRLDPTHWPTGFLPELRDIEQNRSAGTPVFNEMLFSGFLIYVTPHLWVFSDDRCELFGDRMLPDYARELDEPERLEQWARDYGFEMALTRPGSGFDRYPSRTPGWCLDRRTDAASLSRRPR